MPPVYTRDSILTRVLDEKMYEIKDHLGNVRVVVSDVKEPTVQSGEDPFAITLRSYSNYYPFGMLQPGRHYVAVSGGEYRYGFGSHEKIDEVSGSDNVVDMGDRWLLTRLDRTPKPDVKADKYPELSPYSYAANNPILYVDPDGKEIWIYYQVTGSSGAPEIKKVQYLNGKLYETGGAAYTGTNAYVSAVEADLDAFKTDHPEAARRLKVLETSTQVHNIENTSGDNVISFSSTAARAGTPTGSTVKYDPTNWTNPRGARRNPRVGLGHELLGHSYDVDQGQLDYTTTSGISNYEILAVNIENKIRASTGNSQKTTYGGVIIPAAQLDNPNQYTIRSGNTLAGIAKSAGTSIVNLQTLNPSITDPNVIKAGEIIKIR